MRAGLVGVEEFGFRAVALVPVGAHHHPFAGVDGAVLGFPGLDVIDGEEEVVIGGGFLRTVYDIDRADEILRRNGVGGAVRVVLAGDPVLRRVEMRARMLTQLQPAISVELSAEPLVTPDRCFY